MVDTFSPQFQPLYAVQRRWFEALENGDSLLTPGAAIWTREHVDELQRFFIDRPDSTPGRKFLEKLHLQLADASDPARQLMAEVLLEYFLIIWPGAISPRSKLATLETVLSWLASPPAVPDDIREVLALGPVHPGQWAIARRDVQITWIIQFAALWLNLTPESRRELRADPWAFRELTDPLTDGGTENARLALLHLTFPTTFEAVVSPDHKQAIITRYADLAGDATDSDRRLLEIRAALGGAEGSLDWYAEPHRNAWLKDVKKWRALLAWVQRVHETPELEADERPYKLELAEQLAAARTALLDGDPEWTAHLRAALTSKHNNLTRWQDNGTLLEWVTTNPDAAAHAFTALWSGDEAVQQRMTAFLDAVPVEVIGSAIGGRVNVSSFLLMAVDPLSFPGVKITPMRKAWELAGWSSDEGLAASEVYARALALMDEAVHASRQWPTPLRDRLDAQGALWSVTSRSDRASSWSVAEWDELRRYRGDDIVAPEPPHVPPTDEEVVVEPPATVDHIAEAAAELLVDREFLDELAYLLDDKNQIVLYGPPGTGKTYLAKRFARAIAEGRDERYRLVQFHPAMSYEDFIEGLRPKVLPSGQVTYAPTPGPFLLAAEAARAEPDAKHILVIDEINRANLPKVLGELLFLLEYRDEAVNLMLRPDEPFTLPANLYLIGTMNTADRSVALVDAALRRRFHFVPFFPHDGPMRGLLARWLETHGGRRGIAAFLDAVNAELVGTVGEHLLIGPSHFMRTDLSDRALARIWTYNVFPLIEEQLWGQRDEVQRWRWETVRTRFASSLTAVEPASTDDT